MLPKRFSLRLLLFVLTSAALLVAYFSYHPPKPRLFSERDFSSRDVVEAVNYFIHVGEADLVDELSQIHSECQNSEFCVIERIVWVLRILYFDENRMAIHQFPDNPFGKARMPEATIASSGEWSIYPLVKEGDSYFVLFEVPIPKLFEIEIGPIPDYVSRCRHVGKFRTTHLPLPSDSASDLDSFLKSKRWTTLNWGFGPRYLQTNLGNPENVADFLRAQVSESD